MLKQRILGISENRSERPNVGLRSEIVRLYGEHRWREIESRSRFLDVPLCHFESSWFLPHNAGGLKH